MEEGARFAPAMLASGVWAGSSASPFALARQRSRRHQRRRGTGGYRLPRRASDRAARFTPAEVHIEQGTDSEEEDVDIGLVHAGNGPALVQRHAGGLFPPTPATTPMGSRRDALTAFAELALAVEQIGIAHNPDGRATIGMAQVIPIAQRGAGRANAARNSAIRKAARWRQWNRRCIRLPKRWPDAGRRRRSSAFFDYAPIAFDRPVFGAQRASGVQMLGYSARTYWFRRRSRYPLYQQRRARQHDFIPARRN